MEEQPAGRSTSPTPTWGHYANLRPDVLQAIQQNYPVAYIPWGSLVYHGPHLPLGTDGLVAEAVALQAVQQTGGVVLPTTWWTAGTPSHNGQTLTMRTDIIRALARDVLTRLSDSGWRIMILLTGSYQPEHEMALLEVSERLIRDRGLLVLTMPPIALVEHSLLDHGALWESSLLLALYPNLVELYMLDEQQTADLQQVVQGRDPRGTASASLGDIVLDLTVGRLVKAAKDLLDNGDPAPLLAFYETRRERHRQYHDKNTKS